MGDRPGSELPKDYRKVAQELVDNQSWRYDAKRGKGGYPILYPPSGAKPVKCPRTPSSQRRYRNWVSEIRRAGGEWPPEKGGKR